MALIGRRWRWFAAATLVAVAACGFLLWRHLAPGSPHLRTVAVLPLRNLTGDPADDALAGGLTEEVIDALATAHDLTVIARTSAFTWQGRAPDPRSIRQRLDADFAVEGAIQRHGGELSATLRIADAHDGRGLLDRSFSVAPRAGFRLGGELASAVAGVLHVSLPPGPHPPSSERACGLYWRARYDLRQARTPAALDRARGLIGALLLLDPASARAHALLAEYYYDCAEAGTLDFRAAGALSRREAVRAVELDPALPEPYARLGLLSAACGRDLAAAEGEYRKALDLAPGAASTRIRYGFVLILRGRATAGTAEIERALRCDPLSASANNEMVFALFLSRRYAEAIERATRTIDMNASAAVSYYRRAWAYALAGKFDAALRDAAVLEQLRASELLVEPIRGYVYGRLGRPAEARRAAEAIRRSGASGPDYALALVDAGSGDRDALFGHLDAAVASGDPYMLYISVEPQFDSIRSDVRYGRLLERMGLRN
jgi:TolB-like protein/tetratricopeptide (TPR) repeat protein